MAAQGSDLEKVVPITQEQNIICRKTRLDGTTHEQTISRRQLFAGHVVDSRPMERKKKTHRMITKINCPREQNRTEQSYHYSRGHIPKLLYPFHLS